MVKAAKYVLIYAPEVKEHLKAIDRQHHPLIRQTIEQQLTVVPDHETRNRKPLSGSTLWADAWELRCGPQNRFRVFYQIEAARREVLILAVGVKDRNELMIGKEKIEL